MSIIYNYKIYQMPITDRTSFMDNLRSKAQSVTPAPQDNSSIWDMINSESATTRNMKIADQINKLRDKHTIRLNMAQWKVTSW